MLYKDEDTMERYTPCCMSFLKINKMKLTSVLA